MANKRSNQIPLHSIKEWLSRREVFYTSEFRERFYPDNPAGSANMRLMNLKSRELIASTGEIGKWLSNVEPLDVEPVNSIEPPPVGAVNNLPNPIGKSKPKENCFHRQYDNDVFRDAFGTAYLRIREGGEVEPNNGDHYVAQTVLEMKNKLGDNTEMALYNAFRALLDIKLMDTDNQ